MSFVAILLWVNRIFPLGLSLAWLIILRRLPAVLFLCIGGKLADRYNPKLVVLAVNGMMLAVTGVLCGMDYAKTNFYPTLLVSVSIISCLEGVYKPALQVFLCSVCPEKKSLEMANTLLNSSGMLSVILAGILSAVFSGFVELNTMLRIDAATYVVSIALFMAVPLCYRGRQTPESVGVSILARLKPQAFAALQLNSLLAVIYAFVALAAVRYPMEVYGLSSRWTGALNAAIGLGILAAAGLYRLKPALASQQGSAQRIRKTVLGLFIVQSPAFFLFACSPRLSWAVLSLTMAMLCFGYLKILAENLFFLKARPDILGRSFSLLYICEEMVIAGASLTLTYLASFTSLATVGVLLALAMVLLTAWMAAATSASQLVFDVAVRRLKLGMELWSSRRSPDHDPDVWATGSIKPT